MPRWDFSNGENKLVVSSPHFRRALNSGRLSFNSYILRVNCGNLSRVPEGSTSWRSDCDQENRGMFAVAAAAKSARKRREEERLSSLFQRDEILSRIRVLDAFLNEQQQESKFGLNLENHTVDITREDLLKQINGLVLVVKDRIARSTSYRLAFWELYIQASDTLHTCVCVCVCVCVCLCVCVCMYVYTYMFCSLPMFCLGKVTFKGDTCNLRFVVIAFYAVYAGAGHFKQQQFRTGRSTLLNTNTRNYFLRSWWSWLRYVFRCCRQCCMHLPSTGPGEEF